MLVKGLCLGTWKLSLGKSEYDIHMMMIIGMSDIDYYDDNDSDTNITYQK